LLSEIVSRMESARSMAFDECWSDAVLLSISEQNSNTGSDLSAITSSVC
jgi:hypothetical protein